MINKCVRDYCYPYAYREMSCLSRFFGIPFHPPVCESKQRTNIKDFNPEWNACRSKFFEERLKEFHPFLQNNFDSSLFLHSTDSFFSAYLLCYTFWRMDSVHKVIRFENDEFLFGQNISVNFFLKIAIGFFVSETP